MARKTKKPKKLKVERDDNKFLCTWKCGEEYNQSVKYTYTTKTTKEIRKSNSNLVERISNPDYIDLTGTVVKTSSNTVTSEVYKLVKKASKKTITLKWDDYYPKKNIYLNSFSFSVNGDRTGHPESNWVNSDDFAISPPPKMKMDEKSVYEGEYYSSFSYEIPEESPHKPIADFEWQGCLTKDSEVPDWKHPDQTGVRKISEETRFEVTEDKYKGEDIDWTQSYYSYTRHVRIRARGPGGNGEWSNVVTHVYSLGTGSRVFEASVTKNSNRAGYLCKLVWSIEAPKTHPNDEVHIYYTFASPTVNMTCPDDASWEEVTSTSIKDTRDLDSYSFIINSLPSSDHVMFVRVDSIHDSKIVPGEPYYVRGSNASGLTSPIIGSVTPDIDTRRVALSGIQNLSEKPGSFIGVYYRDGYDSGDGKIIGIVTDTSISNVVQLPEWGDKGFALGLKAIAGATATPSTTDPTMYKEENVGKIIPVNTKTLSYSVNRIPMPTTTVTVYYTYSWMVEENLNSETQYASFIGGTSRTVTVDGHYSGESFVVSYDGDDAFTFTISGSSENTTSITIDSISYTYATNEHDNIPIYYDLTPIEAAIKSGIGMMESIVEWSGDIPLPPSNLNVAQDGVNTILATWDWNWKEANTAEISWANHEDAWESTDEPQTYTIENVKASRWKIANLEPGNWYVKVRLIKMSDEASVYGTYATANPFPLKVSSAPSTPTLTLLPEHITADGNTTASWAYECADGTTQSEAEIFEVTKDNQGRNIYTPLSPPARTTSAQFITLYAENQGWREGEYHELAVRVKSTVEELSEDYSAAKGVSIVEKPTCTITYTSLETKTRVVDDGTEDDPTIVTETIPNVLTDLPLTVTVEGAGEGGVTYVTIVRDGPYHGERPDGTDFDGFDGEVIASLSHDGEDPFVIEKTDRSGYFDDGGSYKIIAMVKDSNGQVAKSDVVKSIYELSTDTEVDTGTEYYTYDGTTYTKVVPEDGDNPVSEGWYVNHTYNNFIVLWDHQAIMPDADIEVDTEEEVVFITPKLPDNIPSGWELDPDDTCDIYRLSADKPELIVTGGKFGTKYVDPYPTYGEFGGHRVVFVTKNGDYTIEETEAVVDFGKDDGDILDNTIIKNFKAIIDFDNERIELPYDISVSLKWAKDVTITKYLDGSVNADWNPGIDMTSTINSTVWIEEDSEKIRALRRLAVWPGYCHVRTPEGSSFTADVQVNIDHEEKWVTRLAKVNLTITRVDNFELDGQKYDDWIEEEE